MTNGQKIAAAALAICAMAWMYGMNANANPPAASVMTGLVASGIGFSVLDSAIDSNVTVAPVVIYTADPASQNRYTGMALELNNEAGSSALNSFSIEVKTHPSGSWVSYLSGADFDDPVESNVVFASSTGPHELGANASALVYVALGNAYQYRLKAGVASSTATVNCYVTNVQN